MSKFYAVKIGRNPGIYNSWAECQQQVTGFKGAIFKSFKTKEEAENAKNRLEKESFEDVAKDISTCPSSENGGYLGIFKSEQMVAEFSEALKKLNKNEISDPVKTNFGYHIIKLINYNEKSTISFEQAKEEIKRQFLALKQQEVYINKSNELKKKYNTQIFLND